MERQEMKPLRPTELAERMILILCWSIACFFAGKWMGEEQMADQPAKPCYIVKKQSLDMTKAQEKRWITYWKART